MEMAKSLLPSVVIKPEHHSITAEQGSLNSRRRGKKKRT